MPGIVYRIYDLSKSPKELVQFLDLSIPTSNSESFITHLSLVHPLALV